MSRSHILLGGCIASLIVLPASATEEPALKLSGYYKNLLSKSDTVAPAGAGYTLDLNRLRIELQGRLGPGVALDIQYDNELLFGSYLHTAQFRSQKDQAPDQYWKGDSNYVERPHYYGRHRFYRAHATFSLGDTDMRFGRQRIAWGTGRFWSPLDLINPINPVQVEREERPGVDALLAVHKLGPVSRLSAVYAPRHDRGEASAGGQWHANAGGVDFSLMAGRFRRERVAGADLAGQIGGAGVRVEFTHARPEGGAAYRRGLLAVDYAFANTLTVGGELYYNGAGAASPAAYDFSALFSGRIRSLARRYLGLYAGYEITPLLRWNNSLVANLDDNSRYFSPSLIYSIRTNRDWSMGVQHFRGGADSEYGHFKYLYYTYMQWYF